MHCCSMRSCEPLPHSSCHASLQFAFTPSLTDLLPILFSLPFPPTVYTHEFLLPCPLARTLVVPPHSSSICSLFHSHFLFELCECILIVCNHSPSNQYFSCSLSRAHSFFAWITFCVFTLIHASVFSPCAQSCCPFSSLSFHLPLSLSYLMQNSVGSTPYTNQLYIWKRHVGRKHRNMTSILYLCITPKYDLHLGAKLNRKTGMRSGRDREVLLLPIYLLSYRFLKASMLVSTNTLLFALCTR